jgi:thioredoxin 1
LCRNGPAPVTVNHTATSFPEIATIPHPTADQEHSRVSGNIVHTTDATFEADVLKSSLPVLLDFWAEWCGPCKAIAPILDDLAGEYAGRVRVAKLNIDENRQTPVRYGVRGIPTLILFKDGKVVDQVVGVVPKHQLEGMLNKVL